MSLDEQIRAINYVTKNNGGGGGQGNQHQSFHNVHLALHCTGIQSWRASSSGPRPLSRTWLQHFSPAALIP